MAIPAAKAIVNPIFDPVEEKAKEIRGHTQRVADEGMSGQAALPEQAGMQGMMDQSYEGQYDGMQGADNGMGGSMDTGGYQNAGMQGDGTRQEASGLAVEKSGSLVGNDREQDEQGRYSAVNLSR